MMGIYEVRVERVSRFQLKIEAENEDTACKLANKVVEAGEADRIGFGLTYVVAVTLLEDK